MKMMQEKQNCFDDCECNFDDCCEPRKHCDDDCHKCRRHHDEDCHECRRHHDDDRHECKKRCKDAPEGGKALLRCGKGSSGILPKTDHEGKFFGGTHAINIGSVTIDARNLCNPTVLLSVNLQLTNTAAGGRRRDGGEGRDDSDFALTFTVVKCCKGCTTPVGEGFTFADEIEKGANKSFSFQVCDCNNCCDDCITYTLQISNATLEDAGLLVRADISALAVENNCSNSCC